MSSSQSAALAADTRTIAVFDRRPLLRTLLQDALEHKLGGVAVLDAQRLQERDPEQGPPCLVLVSLDGASAAAAAATRESLVGDAPRAAFVLLSEREDEAFVDEVLGSGYRGVLSTATPLDIVSLALQIVMAGGVYRPCRSANLQARSAAPATAPDPASASSDQDLSVLTTREMEVLGEICRGSPNKIIARALSISENTAKMHVRRIIAKLRVRNRVEAALLFQGRIAVAGARARLERPPALRASLAFPPSPAPR
ncbi:response regulator transcription factor [Salinarimonas sp.]|uniref:response regulator transcription factor n=1 Tax=Salinarimonas sp. TaxID=2766526 RepID=UPI003919E41D